MFGKAKVYYLIQRVFFVVCMWFERSLSEYFPDFGLYNLLYLFRELTAFAYELAFGHFESSAATGTQTLVVYRAYGTSLLMVTLPRSGL